MTALLKWIDYPQAGECPGAAPNLPAHNDEALLDERARRQRRFQEQLGSVGGRDTEHRMAG